MSEAASLPHSLFFAGNRLTIEKELRFLLRSEEYSLLVAGSKSILIHDLSAHPGIRMIIIDTDSVEADAYNATEEIRKSNKDIPIILITRHLTLNSYRLAALTGCTEFIQIPVEPEIFRSLITRHLMEKK